jgi:hypothetical protein
VIRMRVTDKNQVVLWPVRIEPKPQLRKINPALAILEFEHRHATKLGDTGRKCN